MAIEIGTVNADTSVKFGTTTIQSGYIGFNQFYNTYTSILDLYPSAYHAHSLRKLKSTYTGKCLRVRRTNSTPNTLTTTVDLDFDVFNTISLTSKITYVSGATTTATNLGQFCASIVNGYTNPDGVNTNQSVFVVTWFDQSGNGKNPTNATSASQPRIVDLGNLTMSEGKAAVRFVSANSNLLSLNDTSIPYNNVSSYALGNAITNTTNNAMLTLGYINSSNIFWLPSATNVGYISASAFTNNGVVVGQNRLYELIAGSVTTSAYSDGTQLTPSTVLSSLQSNTFIRLGTRAAVPAIYLDGYISEAISFVGTSNRTQIESNINTYYSVW